MTRLVLATSVLLATCAVGASAQENRMRVVDPLGGSWRADRIGAVAVREGQEATVFFTGGVWYATQAGCGNFGGSYTLIGDRLRTEPRDDLNLSKCESPAAARIETALARFMADAARWTIQPDGTLQVVARDGRRMALRRPKPTIPALAGRWTVETIGRDRLDPRKRARMWFDAGGLTAVADCNQFSAGYEATATGLAVGQGAATQMGCGRAREAFDGRFFSAVGKVRRYALLPGGRVRLEGGEPLALARPAPVDTTLDGSYAVCGDNPRGVLYDGVATLRFQGGRVRDSAGCSGSYQATGALLDIRRDAGPACRVPLPSLNAAADLEIGERKSILATLRPDAFAFDNEGTLSLRTTRGLLRMCREGLPKPFGAG